VSIGILTEHRARQNPLFKIEKMKPEKLSPKALMIMANLHGMSSSVTSRQLSFLAPSPTGAAEWSFSTLRRLHEMGFVTHGDRIENAVSFVLSDEGRNALVAQTKAIDVLEGVNPEDALYTYDGPMLFVAELFGATRLVMADDANGETYLISSPSADVLDQVITSQIRVVEGMVCEPCMRITRDPNDEKWSLSSQKESGASMREYCGESTFLDLNIDKKSKENECPSIAD